MWMNLEMKWLHCRCSFHLWQRYDGHSSSSYHLSSASDYYLICLMGMDLYLPLHNLMAMDFLGLLLFHCYFCLLFPRAGDGLFLGTFCFIVTFRSIFVVLGGLVFPPPDPFSSWDLSLPPGIPSPSKQTPLLELHLSVGLQSVSDLHKPQFTVSPFSSPEAAVDRQCLKFVCQFNFTTYLHRNNPMTSYTSYQAYHTQGFADDTHVPLSQIPRATPRANCTSLPRTPLQFGLCIQIFFFI